VDDLRGERFDLLVIGGGIYGAWVAYDAALRGLRVALVEQRDWAAGTSSASSKLIHGGLRYLEQRDFGLVRTSLDERRRLAQLAPHRVTPLRFALPIYAGSRVGRLRLKAGLWLYDRIGGGGQPVRGHRYLGRRALLERYGFLAAGGLRGGFEFGDCQTDDARFTLEIVGGAIDAGAVALNRVRATRLLHDGSRVAGAEVQDLETQATLEVRARLTFDCAGPWVQKLLDGTGVAVEGLTRLSKGVHLVLPALPTEDAFLLMTDEGRVVFLIPWYGRTLLGTTDTDYTGAPGFERVEMRDVGYLLDQANRCLDGAPWGQSDVIGSFAGLRALPSAADASPSTISREWSMVELADGLLASVGGKYTSARADAAEGVDRALQLLGREPIPCPTGERPTPWAPRSGAFHDWRATAISRGMAVGLDEEAAESCALRHGSRVDRLLELMDNEPELARRIVPEAPFCRGEVVFAAKDEMARTLIDVLRRRIPLLLLAPPARTVLLEVAELMAAALDWTAERVEREVATITDAHRAGPSR
jgi:glycerol-3-phosphate dehydrogenase